MADLTITVADIQLSGDGVQTNYGEASAAITQGQAVVQDSSTRKWAPAINTAEATAGATGIALTKAAADGDYLFVATQGALIIGATLSVGTTYYLSDTSGGIMPQGDLTAGDWVTRIGVATSTAIMQLDFDVSGVQFV